MKAATVLYRPLVGADVISIHAAREGGDRRTPCRLAVTNRFQSTPPVKAATYSLGCVCTDDLFQSTPPVKAATDGGSAHQPLTEFQSTPPVKAATLPLRAAARAEPISIHAAREGGDHVNVKLYPHRRISIHAAREGGDPRPRQAAGKREHFNPRRP